MAKGTRTIAPKWWFPVGPQEGFTGAWEKDTPSSSPCPALLLPLPPFRSPCRKVGLQSQRGRCPLLLLLAPFWPFEYYASIGRI